MEKQLRILSLVFLFGLISTSVIGQRRDCSIPSVTLTPTISHATCFNSLGDISYEIAAPNGSYVNIKLYDEDGNVVYEHESYTLSGQVSDLPVGSYRFAGSVAVQYQCDGLWYMAPVSVDLSVWLGIETVWVEKIDMVSSPNSYSAKRNTTTTAYGGVRSSNGITSGDGWVEMSAVYGGTTDSRVYWLIGETNPLGTFSPNSQIPFIEFYQSSAGNGIRLKYESTGGSFLYTTLSTDPSDKIRLIRTGSYLSIQKNNSPTSIFNLPVSYTGPMNITIRTLAINDGCQDVISSFGCRSEVYAKLERTLRGVKYQATGNMLKFYIAEEYDDQTNTLDYQVFKEGDRTNSYLSGAQSKTVAFGDNRYSLDVSTLSAGSYILEVTNKKKENFYLRFIKE